MWCLASGSGSGSSAQMSEYERQRLENISQMNEEFSGLIETVSIAAQDLAKASSSSAASSSNGRKRNPNSQQWHQVKMASKPKEKPPPRVTRRSKRLINGNRKKPEYDEQSDSDEKSSLIKLKFPFFKKKEFVEKDEDYYRKLNDDDFITSDEEEYDDDYNTPSKRKRRDLANTHQVPVSLITKEMLNNITYSSCGKNYSSENGTTCHQCRQKTTDQKSYCRYKKCRGIRGMFCGFCLGKRYGEDVAEVLLNKKWACPPCRGHCNCSICRRKQGRPPTGQLAHIAEAEGYKSVKHMLETVEGGGAEPQLSSDYDSDVDHNKDVRKDEISKGVNKNINNDVISNENPKTDNLDEKEVSCNDENLILDKENNLSNALDSNKDDIKDDQEEKMSEGTYDTNLNDKEIKNRDVLSKRKSKIDNYNKKAMKTEQSNLIVTLTENKNVPDNVNCYNSSEKKVDLSNEMILNKLYKELYSVQEA